MQRSSSFFIAGLAVGIVLATAAFSIYIRAGNLKGASDGDVVVLKLGHGLDTQHPVHAGMEYMAKRFSELSGGKAELQIYPNGQLGSETENIEQLQRGALDMTKTSAAPMEGFVEEMGVFGVPYIFRDRDHMWKVLDGEVGKELLLKSKPKGLLGLCYYDAGSRSFYTIDKPILKPADLNGQKIRTMRSKTAMDMIQVMGGAPTPIPWGELYTALQQKMVDGAENNPASFYSNRHYEVAKHFSLDEHTMLPDVLLISASVWDSLPVHIQRWLQQAADDSSVFQRKLWEQKTVEALAEVEKLGVTIYHPDKQPFVDQVAPMHRSYEKTAVGELMQRIIEVE